MSIKHTCLATIFFASCVFPVISPEKFSLAMVVFLAVTSFLLDKPHSRKEVLSRMTQLIKSRPGAQIDYVELVSAETIDEIEEIKGVILLVMAVKFGKTRLIDNVMFEVLSFNDEDYCVRCDID